MNLLNRQLFSVAFVGLLAVAPVLAADGTTSGDSATVKTASRGMECSRASCSGISHHGPRMNLSDAQLEKMASLKDKFLDNTANDRTQIGSLYRQLKEVMTKPEVDRSQALAIQSKINGVKDDISTAKLNLRLDEMSVLTPEQREQIRHRMLVSEAFGGARFGHHKHFGHHQHGGASRQDKA